jgi:hypothetical protein
MFDGENPMISGCPKNLGTYEPFAIKLSTKKSSSSSDPYDQIADS